MSDDDFEVVRGSGNVYADLGDTDPGMKQMKAQLAAEIIAVLDRRKVNGREGEKLTGAPRLTFPAFAMPILAASPSTVLSAC